VSHHDLTSRQKQRRMRAAQSASDKLGHADLGTTKGLRDARMLDSGGGIRLGYTTDTDELITYTEKDGHGLVVAPTGSGKNRDFETAALLHYPASAVVVDPKGSLCATTFRYRAAMGKVFVLNPFENDP